MNREQLEAALDGVGMDDSDKAHVLMKFDQTAPPAPETAESAAPQGVAGEAEIRRVIRELRAYSPPGDQYKGAHIHGLWARELEAALAQAGQAALAGEVASELAKRLTKLSDEAEAKRQLETNEYLERIHLGMRDAYHHAAALATPATEPAAPGYVSDEQIHRIADETFRDYVEDRNDDADIAFARAVLAAASKTGGA